MIAETRAGVRLPVFNASRILELGSKRVFHGVEMFAEGWGGF